jgi:single-stranded-DNA-specific exonuclease
MLKTENLELIMPDKIIKRRISNNNIARNCSFGNLHPVLKRIFVTRNIKSIKELDYSLNNLLPYNKLLNINNAVKLLHEALDKKWRILVVADFDVDGATSCVVCLRSLRMMGADINYIVPNRFKHGYGLSSAIIEDIDNFAERPQLIITVDNGISNIFGVQAAKDRGIKVLITDHHLIGKSLPKADAIINPNLYNDKFPSKNLAGVGVIFYVMIALRAYLQKKSWFKNNDIPFPNLANLLDLVALGTIADMVKLDYNNRIMVEQGLRRIRSNECCAGIRALCQISKCQQDSIIASDFAFKLAPRLNAAGRMDDMSFGIECLLSDDHGDAINKARNLDIFNKKRRTVEAEMKADADTILAELEHKNIEKMGLCLYDKNWHQGVIGILASRINDKLHRPVIIFSLADNDEIKGSARSVKKVHIRDVLAKIDTDNPNLINKFGGHAMAAGLSMSLKDLEKFRDLFNYEIENILLQDDLQGIIYSDGNLASKYFNLSLFEIVRSSTPWGQDFLEPIFDDEFIIVKRQLINNEHLKMTLRTLDYKAQIQAIAFNTVDTDWSFDVKFIKLVYRLDINAYNNHKNIQLIVEYIAKVF